MRFLHPEIAVWLLAIPPVALLGLIRALYRRRSRARQGIQPRFASISRRSGLAGDAGSTLLACAAIALLVGAAARPQLLRAHRTAEFEKQDLVILLDRSASMHARDVPPSRAARALAELRMFLQRKPAEIDRVALIGFAATPLVVSYLTRDVDSLLFYVDWLREDPSVLYGTDIGAAMASGLDVTTRDTAPGRKLFLVISDGEDDGSTLAGSVAAVRGRGIHVHAIGIGSSGRAVIPVSRSGERDVFLRDDTGQLMTTRFDETSLRSVAAATGGRYVRSQRAGDVLQALDTIVRADRRRIGTRTVYEYTDIRDILLAGALVAVACLVATA